MKKYLRHETCLLCALQRRGIDDCASGVRRPVDAIRSHARGGDALTECGEYQSHRQREFLVAAAATASTNGDRRFTRRDDAERPRARTHVGGQMVDMRDGALTRFAGHWFPDHEDVISEIAGCRFSTIDGAALRSDHPSDRSLQRLVTR